MTDLADWLDTLACHTEGTLVARAIEKGAAHIVPGFVDEARMLHQAATALRAAEAELATEKAKREALCRIAETARDVSLATTQDDIGRWIIDGDGELLSGALYDALEEYRALTKLETKG